ncbi:MAG: Stp1/IreP family PP2C-type Ser/Thr phosphatase [Firmicutes bacterium]|nr:Stp1/IreP family PP2C-type Ser/Thr phosphatase [Bacillota bacterium]
MKSLRAAGITDRGKVRANNEDRYLIIGKNSLQVFAVADGMGGHAAGEVASSMALDAIQSYLNHYQKDIIAKAAEGESLRTTLEEMLSAANEKVFTAGKNKPEYSGMGTTLTLLLFVSDCCWLAHIGDSRAYLLRQNRLVLLTEDHTLVSQLVKNGQISEEECADHPQRHILTRALGTDNEAIFDVLPLEIKPGDRLLLCTDGLHGFVAEEEILAVAGQNKEPDDIVGDLVFLANEKGGMDNITIVLIDVV